MCNILCIKIPPTPALPIHFSPESTSLMTRFKQRHMTSHFTCNYFCTIPMLMYTLILLDEDDDDAISAVNDCFFQGGHRRMFKYEYARSSIVMGQVREEIFWMRKIETCVCHCAMLILNTT